jgi:hypothetical protein
MKSRFMLKTSVVVFGLGAMLSLPGVNRGADSNVAAKTVTGEIVDLLPGSRRSCANE